MEKKGGGVDSSFSPSLGERAVWNANIPDHECDCPGPPPQFFLPPPPQPSSIVDSDCSDNSASSLEMCEVVPVIDAEYHYRPAIPSLVIILAIVVAVVTLLLLGTFLVLLKKKKVQNLFPGKSSPQNFCNAASANSVIYEDLTNISSRTFSPYCPSVQTTLPPIEMVDVASYSDHTMFTPVFICPSSPIRDSYNSQELFNPVYEELSNESGERDETDSEEMPQAEVSEDEFAEDELSLGGEVEVRLEKEKKQNDSTLHRFVKNNVSRDADSSDADDKSKFLKNSERNSGLISDYREKGKRMNRGSRSRGATKKPKSLDKKKIKKDKAPPSLPAPVMDCNEFHEGFLLKKILQIYPDVTGMDLKYSLRPPTSRSLENNLLSENLCESSVTFNDAHPYAQSNRPKPEIFSTFAFIQSAVKNQNLDSSLGSDSGFSNNSLGGKSFSRTHKEYAASKLSDPVLS